MTVMRAPAGDLEGLLARRIESARLRMLDAGGHIEAADLDEIERLAKFVALQKQTEPAKQQYHVLAISLLVGTLVVVSLLMYARLSSTEIEMLAVATQVGFRVQVPQTLSEGMEASDLLVTCACDIRVPSSPGQPPRVLTMSTADAVVRLTTASAGERRGSITIAPLTLEPDSVVRLRHSGTSGRYGLWMVVPSLTLRVNLYGPIQLAMPGELPETIDFVVPKAMLAATGGKALTLDIQTSDKSALGLTPQLLINELSFQRVDQPATSGLPVRRVSTLQGGTLYWEALNGVERTLRPSEQIEFDGVLGELLAMELKPTEMTLRFHGNVSAVTAGWGENRRSLMPTWLEWLRARHGLSLLWGSTVYIVGLLMGALRWFKVAL